MNRALALVVCVLVPLSAVAQDDASLLAPLTRPHQRAAKQPKHDDLDVIAPLGKAPPKRTTRITVRAGTVSGAQVAVDGKDWGPAPAVEHAIRPGRHEVSVSRPGFAPFHRRVVVRRGAHLTVNATLQPVRSVLTVTTVPAGAELTLDGEPLGKTPLTAREVKPGNYELRLRAQGFMEDLSRVELRAGQDTVIARKLLPVPRPDRPRAVSLAPTTAGSVGPGPVAAPPMAAVASAPEVEAEAEPSTPWFKRWYVWAGAGAVVAAVAVGVAASSGGTTVGAPPSPSAVCGGPCDGVLTP